MDHDISKLSQTLRRLGFDESVDESLLEGITKVEGPFTLTTPLDKNENGISYRLHVMQHAPHHYDLAGYDALLYRTMEIPHANINGTRIRSLQESMVRLDWNIPQTSWPSDKQEIWRDVQDTLYDLTRTEVGKRMAELLIARYIPDTFGLYNWTPGLQYHHDRHQYYIAYSGTADDAVSIKKSTEILISEMDNAMPHLYQVKLTVMDLGTGLVGQLRSKDDYPDLTPAGKLFNSISNPHFDRERMGQLQFPWVVLNAQILDKVDNYPLITKTVHFSRENTPGDPGVSITFDQNASKMVPAEFFTTANRQFPLHPDDMDVMTDLSGLFVPIDPTKQPQKRERTRQEPSDNSGRHKRRHGK